MAVRYVHVKTYKGLYDYMILVDTETIAGTLIYRMFQTAIVRYLRKSCPRNDVPSTSQSHANGCRVRIEWQGPGRRMTELYSTCTLH